MAQVTLTVARSATYCCPTIRYMPVFRDSPSSNNGYSNQNGYRDSNYWYKNHSRTDKWKMRYQGGTPTYSGNKPTNFGHYNGNMMSLFWFVDSNGTPLQQVIRNIGADKITKITLRATCETVFGGNSYADFNFVSGSTNNEWDFLRQKNDSYSTTRTTYLKEIRMKPGETKYIDLTDKKSIIQNNVTLGIYRPGSFGKHLYYGSLYDETRGSSKAPVITIEYSVNAAPHSPTVSSTAHGQNGYYKADSFHFDVTSNGDPDNNIHAQPYSCEVFDSRGNKLASTAWQSGTNFRFNASNYRGDSLKVVGYVRDSIGLQSISERIFHINSLPYWQNHGSESNAIYFNTGVHNGVFKGDITISWPAAKDKENKDNVKYALYAQIGSDNGPSGDNGNTAVAYNLTTNSHTFNPAKLGDRVVQKGERVYFSVWASDGLEYSSYRLVSSWIAREATPNGLTDVYPAKGAFKKEVTVSWKKPVLQSGVSVDHYKIELLNDNEKVVRTYTTKETEFVCRDLDLFQENEHFKFKVSVITNLGSESSASYSGRLKVKARPPSPNFSIDKFIENEYLSVSYSSPDVDMDGDPITLHVSSGRSLSLNDNDELNDYSKKISSRAWKGHTFLLSKYPNGATVSVSGWTTNIYGESSDSIGMSTTIKRNYPPSQGSFVFPKNNSTLYSNVPRIVFKVGTDDIASYLSVVITINGKSYSSSNSSYFDKTSYLERSEGIFMIPKEAALKVGNNSISIKMYDGNSYGSTVSINLKYVNMPFEKKSKGDLITAKDTNILKSMINSNREAYGLSLLNIIDAQPGVYINNQYLKNEFNSLLELSNFLNNKTKNNSLKRKYSYPKIDDRISVDLINTVCKMIKEP